MTFECLEDKNKELFPYDKIALPEGGWLACHPGAMMRAHDTNIQGRYSFVTGFRTPEHKVLFSYHPADQCHM